MRVIIALLLILLLVGCNNQTISETESEKSAVLSLSAEIDKLSEINNFEDCKDAGNPIVRGYDRNCLHDGEWITEQPAFNDRDEHACLSAAGWWWCRTSKSCQRERCEIE